MYSTYYDIVYPNHERQAGRPLRESPLYSRHEALGAVFGEKSGWERVNHYASNEDGAHEHLRPRGWAGQHWSTAIVTEHLATRHTAGLFDESSFAKIEVAGPGAVAFLQHLCVNDVDRAVGSVVYTSMLNSRGGIECDFTVTRLAAERFLVVTGTAFARHDLSWIEQHAPDDGTVSVRDVTSSMACLGLWGPSARNILVDVCDDDLTFPYMQARRITVGDVPCWALRVTYVGELGWELYPPTEFGRRLWDTLVTAGAAHGLVPGRVPRHRQLAAREGLPGVGRRHHERDRSVRGRPRVRGPDGQGVPRPRPLERRAIGPTPRLPRAGRSPVGRARERAGEALGRGRRTRVERWTRLLARALDRVRVGPVRTGRAGHAVDGRGLRRDVDAEVRADPLFDPAGARIRARS